MKIIKLFLSLILISSFFSISAVAATKTPLNTHRQKLFKEPKYNRCFYYESVKKSAKYGWLNQKQAQKIANLKRKPVFAQNSPSELRRVFVPKNWCRGS